ncbi:MAG: PD-(D/E)XK nuclease family protein [Polyangiales bacterium]
MAAALRQMGVESLFDTELRSRAQAARRRGASAAVTGAIEHLARDLWALAQDGTAAEHAERLARWLDRAGGDGRFLEESRAVITAAGSDSGARAILRALARDEAGLGATFELLRELPEAAKAAGRDGRMSVGEFGEMVLDLARVQRLDDPSRAEADGVQVLSAREAAGRVFEAVALPGMQDGGFPARREDEALWDDAERMATGRALKAPIERSSSREDETLLLLSVLATATRAVAVSCARHDAGGRVHTPSPFFGDLQRSAGVTVERVGSDPLARSRRLPPRGAERSLRALAARPEADDDGRSAALASVRARAGVERVRQVFFSTPGREGGPYTGRIDHDDALVARLDLAGWASVERPLDTTTLERAARCGFKAFALEVLRIEERHDTAETLDDKERGHLLHKLLEAAQDAMQETQGLDHAARWLALSAALDEAGDEFSLKESQVNVGLLEADLRAIRRQVEQWLARRLGDPDAWEMVASEIAFGPKRAWPAVEVPMQDGAPVVIRGRIDGIERSGAALRAVEFKSGRGDGYRKRLQEGALDTQFQLIVYAAALEGARRAGAIAGGAGLVDGVYVGFRDLGEHSLREALSRPRRGRPPLDVDALVAEGALGGGALGEAVARVVSPLRRGHFEPRPRDCDFCQYRSLCRVEAYDDDADLREERA